MFNQLSNFHVIDNFVYDINLVPDMFIDFIPYSGILKHKLLLFQRDLMKNWFCVVFHELAYGLTLFATTLAC